MSVKVDGTGFNWLEKSNNTGNNATSFYAVGTAAKISDSPTNVTSGTRHQVSVVIVVPRVDLTIKLNSLAQADASNATNFLTHDICILEKTTADANTCPSPVAPATDPVILMSNAKFFLQVASQNTNAAPAA